MSSLFSQVNSASNPWVRLQDRIKREEEKRKKEEAAGSCLVHNVSFSTENAIAQGHAATGGGTAAAP